MKEHSQLNRVVEDHKKLSIGLADFRALVGELVSSSSKVHSLCSSDSLTEMAKDESDECFSEAMGLLNRIYKDATDMEMLILMCKEADTEACYLEVQAGAGGTER